MCVIDFRLPEIMYNILHRTVGHTQVDTDAKPFHKKHPAFPEDNYIRRKKDLVALTNTWDAVVAKIRTTGNKCPQIMYVTAFKYQSQILVTSI